MQLLPDAHTTAATMNCNPSVPTPATRRLRRLGGSEGSSGMLVYVGANPVKKKTTKMLRKRHHSAPKKTVPKRASSKNQLKKTARGRMSSDTPTVPRRKLSNPTLSDDSPLQAAKTIMLPCQIGPCTMALDAPLVPRRMPSFPDTDEDSDDETCAAARSRFSKQMMTRAQSKGTLVEEPASTSRHTLRAPCRKPSFPDMDTD